MTERQAHGATPTPTSRWETLPEDLRRQVDAFVLDRKTIAALACLTAAELEPRLGLGTSMELVAERTAALADQITPEEAAPISVESLVAKAAGLPSGPQAIEAVWDGDTIGWCVVLLAVTRTPRTEATLAVIRHGGDLRLFNGQVPPWPEVLDAARLGAAVADHLGVPFFFASPETPELDVPRWWDS